MILVEGTRACIDAMQKLDYSRCHLNEDMSGECVHVREVYLKKIGFQVRSTWTHKHDLEVSVCDSEVHKNMQSM